MRFAIEVYEAIRAVVPERKPIGMRILVNRLADGGWTSTTALCWPLNSRTRLDYITASSGARCRSSS